MNWIKENPFVTGLVATLVVLLGVFGYLLSQQRGQYAEISEKFNTQSAEAQRLQNLKPYPDKSNLEKATAEKEAYKEKVEQLQKKLISFNIPITPIRVDQFVQRLRDLNRGITDSATERGIKLPEDFYMGFEKYVASPPSEKAAPRLNQQLEAIDTVLKLLVSKSIAEIKTLKRDEIPEEADGNKTTEPGLVTRSTFLLEFRADHEKVRDILNNLVKMDKPFLVIRNLRFVNDVVDAVPRAPVASGPDPAMAAAAAPDPNAAAGAELNDPNPPLPTNPVIITTLVGAERITVSLEIEILTFGEGPATAPAPAGKPEKKRRT